MQTIFTNLTLAALDFKDLGLPDGQINSGSGGTIASILSIVLTIMGAVCLLIVTIAGFKYSMSMGDPSATKKAKDTILYAFIGLIVSILAVSIVTFVTNGVS